eukprot:8350839-Pyramimonas_sp.AAC.1
MDVFPEQCLHLGYHTSLLRNWAAGPVYGPGCPVPVRRRPTLPRNAKSVCGPGGPVPVRRRTT